MAPQMTMNVHLLRRWISLSLDQGGRRANELRLEPPCPADGDEAVATLHEVEVYRVDYCGGCHAPMLLVFYGAYRGLQRAEIHVNVRCRRCENCALVKSLQWRERAMIETDLSVRTWFTTLTFSPKHMFDIVMKADQWLRERKKELELVDDREEFSAMCREAGRYCTLYLKRLRSIQKKQRGLRYMLVFERHSGNGDHHGCPHMHMLIHEPIMGATCTERMLRNTWNYGFSRHKLVDPGDNGKTVRYVCKYLTKDLGARVRASQKYGTGPQALIKARNEATRLSAEAPMPPQSGL